MSRITIRQTYKTARRVVIATVGGTVVLVGLALLVLPGPAFVVIPAGLAILGLEFAWARRWLRKVRNSAGNAWDAITGKPDDDKHEDKDQK